MGGIFTRQSVELQSADAEQCPPLGTSSFPIGGLNVRWRHDYMYSYQLMIETPAKDVACV